jgi:hypothetical protein
MLNIGYTQSQHEANSRSIPFSLVGIIFVAFSISILGILFNDIGELLISFAESESCLVVCMLLLPFGSLIY